MHFSITFPTAGGFEIVGFRFAESVDKWIAGLLVNRHTGPCGGLTGDFWDVPYWKERTLGSFEHVQMRFWWMMGSLSGICS